MSARSSRLTFVIETVGDLKLLLQAQGIAHVYVFGSVARGDDEEASDVDLAFDLAADAVRFSLIDQSRIQRQLTEAVGAKVDFIERAYIRPRVRAGFDACHLQVF